MNSVSDPKPSCRACSNTPETGSTKAEMVTASGLSALIFVNCAAKSVSLLPKLSVATIFKPTALAAAYITSKPDFEKPSSFA